jgi:hypothetical protein
MPRRRSAICPELPRASSFLATSRCSCSVALINAASSLSCTIRRSLWPPCLPSRILSRRLSSALHSYLRCQQGQNSETAQLQPAIKDGRDTSEQAERHSPTVQDSRASIETSGAPNKLAANRTITGGLDDGRRARNSAKPQTPDGLFSRPIIPCVSHNTACNDSSPAFFGSIACRIITSKPGIVDPGPGKPDAANIEIGAQRCRPAFEARKRRSTSKSDDSVKFGHYRLAAAAILAAMDLCGSHVRRGDSLG